jgi:hypothetical protein
VISPFAWQKNFDLNLRLHGAQLNLNNLLAWLVDLAQESQITCRTVQYAVAWIDTLNPGLYSPGIFPI